MYVGIYRVSPQKVGFVFRAHFRGLNRGKNEKEETSQKLIIFNHDGKLACLLATIVTYRNSAGDWALLWPCQYLISLINIYYIKYEILIHIKYLYHDNIKTVNKAELIQLRRPVFPQVIGLNHLNKHKYHCRTISWKVTARSFITSKDPTLKYQISDIIIIIN